MPKDMRITASEIHGWRTDVAKIRREIAERTQRLQELERKLEAVKILDPHMFAATVHVNGSGNMILSASDTLVSVSEPSSQEDMPFSRRVESVIRQFNAPVTRAALREELTKQGFERYLGGVFYTTIMRLKKSGRIVEEDGRFIAAARAS